MNDSQNSDFGPVVHVRPARSDADVIVVCEHASNRIPDGTALGLPPALRDNHIAWDPGALPVATALADLLDAPLVHGGISRLVYDCNRPPEAPDAIPARSESHDIPGNATLTEAGRQERIGNVYLPFRDTLAAEISSRKAALSLMVTVHSFTPVFHGRQRDVEIGLLYGTDPRFAAAMAALPPKGWRFDTRINEPYGPEDGVAHTLDVHGSANGLRNVMLEIRNDLIATADAQQQMARDLAGWITATLASTAARGAA